MFFETVIRYLGGLLSAYANDMPDGVTLILLRENTRLVPVVLVILDVPAWGLTRGERGAYLLVLGETRVS